MPMLLRNELAANCCPARPFFLRFEVKSECRQDACSGLVFSESSGLFSKDFCIFKEKPFSTEINARASTALDQKNGSCAMMT